MKIKYCAYCDNNYNLLPAIVVSPALKWVVPIPYTGRVLEKTGFRIAMKLWNWHLGVEVMK